MRATFARVLVVAAAAVCATAVAIPTASAAGSDLIFGGCGFNTDENATVTGPDTNTGVIYDHSATFDATGLPTSATVSCQIQVNDVAAPGTTVSYSGFGLQAGANPISFTAAPDQSVSLCQRVVYGDGTDTGWVCPMTDPCFSVGGCPPEALTLVEGIVNNAFTSVIDPALCPVFAANAGDYGLVTINSDGDVDVADPLGLGLNPVYDCPPYGNF